MTYLQLVNAVLKRMREATVSTVSANALSSLVGEFVNDAKRVVEDAWQWQALMDWVQVPLLASTSTYSLNSVNTVISGAPLRSRARPRRDLVDGSIAAYIITLNFESQLYEFQLDSSYNLLIAQQNQLVYAIPSGLTFLPEPSVVSGLINKRVLFTATPDRSLTVQMFFTNPQEPFTSDSTAMVVPDQPVIQLAYLYSLYERGEELGEFIGLTKAKADQALQDAVAFDQALQSFSPTFNVESSTSVITS